MLRDIEESGGRPREIAVEILRLAHGKPRIVEKRIELVAGAERLFLVGRSLFGRFFLYGMQLDRLLHLLDGPLEVARRLRTLLVGSRLGRMDEHCACIVILIPRLHSLKLLVIMRLSVEIDIITSVESVPLARQRRVLLRAAGGEHKRDRHEHQKLQQIFCKNRHRIKTTDKYILLLHFFL